MRGDIGVKMVSGYHLMSVGIFLKNVSPECQKILRVLACSFKFDKNIFVCLVLLLFSPCHLIGVDGVDVVGCWFMVIYWCEEQLVFHYHFFVDVNLLSIDNSLHPSIFI